MTASNAKLTLLMNKEVIKNAKKYAQKRGKSISKIVQDYLGSIAGTEAAFEKSHTGPITQALHGVLKGKVSADFKIDIADYMEKKYR